MLRKIESTKVDLFVTCYHFQLNITKKLTILLIRYR